MSKLIQLAIQFENQISLQTQNHSDEKVHEWHLKISFTISADAVFYILPPCSISVLESTAEAAAVQLLPQGASSGVSFPFIPAEM